MLRSLVGSEMCIRDRPYTDYGGYLRGDAGKTEEHRPTTETAPENRSGCAGTGTEEYRAGFARRGRVTPGYPETIRLVYDALP